MYPTWRCEGTTNAASKMDAPSKKGKCRPEEYDNLDVNRVLEFWYRDKIDSQNEEPAYQARVSISVTYFKRRDKDGNYQKTRIPIN